MEHEHSNWYVVQTGTGDETKIYKISRSEFGAIYLPLKEVLQKRFGGFVKKQWPLFPGYLFVKGDIHRFLDTIRHGDLDVSVKPLGALGRPKPVKSEEMELIFKLAENGVVGISKGSMGKDGKMHILDGPMKGMEGEIQFIDKRRKKAKVQFDLFERKIDVTLALEIV